MSPEEILRAKVERAAEEARVERERAAIPARWGEEPLSDERKAAFERQGMRKGFEYDTDLRGRLRYAHTKDVFASLHSRNGLTDDQLNAVRRLDRDMIERAGHGRRAPDGVVVDQSADHAAVTQRMVDAGKRVDAVLQRVGPPSERILRGLIEPVIGDMDWKQIIFGVTGESRPEVQAGLVRIAAQSLAECYQAIDKAKR